MLVAHEFEECPCTPCSVVVFVHVKAFCSQLATEHCWATCHGKNDPPKIDPGGSNFSGKSDLGD